MITTVWTWLVDVDWLIVGIVAAWLAYIRRGDLAAIKDRLTRKPSRSDASGPVIWVPSNVDAEPPAAPADPVDRALLEIQKRRDTLAAEFESIGQRADKIVAELKRIDAIFAKPAKAAAPTPEPPEFVR